MPRSVATSIWADQAFWAEQRRKWEEQMAKPSPLLFGKDKK